MHLLGTNDVLFDHVTSLLPTGPHNPAERNSNITYELARAGFITTRLFKKITDGHQITVLSSSTNPSSIHLEQCVLHACGQYGGLD
jgi:hypothetical protein